MKLIYLCLPVLLAAQCSAGPEFKCPGPGFFADPKSCTAFYRCLNKNMNYRYICPAGTRYDPRVSNCNHNFLVPACHLGLRPTNPSGSQSSGGISSGSNGSSGSGGSQSSGSITSGSGGSQGSGSQSSGSGENNSSGSQGSGSINGESQSNNSNGGSGSSSSGNGSQSSGSGESQSSGSQSGSNVSSGSSSSTSGSSGGSVSGSSGGSFDGSSGGSFDGSSGSSVSGSSGGSVSGSSGGSVGGSSGGSVSGSSGSGTSGNNQDTGTMYPPTMKPGGVDDQGEGGDINDNHTNVDNHQDLTSGGQQQTNVDQSNDSESTEEAAEGPITDIDIPGDNGGQLEAITRPPENGGQSVEAITEPPVDVDESVVESNYTVDADSLYPCVNTGYFAEDSNCREFYMCKEILPGVLNAERIFRCPERYLFDRVTNLCQRQEKVVCDDPGYLSRSSLAVHLSVAELDAFFRQVLYYQGPAQTIARVPFTKPTPAASVQYQTFARRNLFVAPLFNPFARIYHRVPTYNPYFFLA